MVFKATKTGEPPLHTLHVGELLPPDTIAYRVGRITGLGGLAPTSSEIDNHRYVSSVASFPRDAKNDRRREGPRGKGSFARIKIWSSSRALEV